LEKSGREAGGEWREGREEAEEGEGGGEMDELRGWSAALTVKCCWRERLKE